MLKFFCGFMLFCLSAFGCREEVGEQASSVHYVHAGRTWLRLPANSQRFLTGTLLEGPDGQTIWGLTGLRYQHSDIRNFLMRRMRWASGEVRHLWSGELMISNDKNYEAQGHIVAANETAKDYAVFWMPQGATNDVKRLTHMIRDRLPELYHSKPLKMTYQRSVDLKFLHLLPGMDEMINSLGEMRSTGAVDHRAELRHYINTKAAILMLLPDFYRMQEGRFEAADPSILDDKLREGLGYEAFKLYLSWFRNDGIENPLIDRILERLNQWKAGNIRTMNEWKTLVSAIEAFDDQMCLGINDPDEKAREIDLIWLLPK